MGINSVVTAGILSGALLFGQTVSDTEYPKEIDEGTYSLVPVYVQEINWSDNGSKLNMLHTKSYIDDDGILHLYNTQNHKEELSVSDSLEQNINYNESENYNTNDNSVQNNDISTDINVNDNKGMFYRDKFMYSDMQELERAYKNAGYEHIVVRFPVTKDEPYYRSKLEFLNKVPFDEISDIAVFGFASPDGKIPEMQEDLAEKRKNKILSYIENEGISVDNTEYFVCDKSVTRSLCWKVDVFYK